MEKYKRIASALASVGFSTDGIDCNLDNCKMKGRTGEGEVTVCVIDLKLKMPMSTNWDDPKEIVAYIEKSQKESQQTK